MNESYLWVFLVVLAIACYYYFQEYKKRKNLEIEIELAKKQYKTLELDIERTINAKLETFKNAELENEIKKIEKNLYNAAKLNLEKWKMEEETTIRQDAIKISEAVIKGKVTEHLIPYFPTVFPYNPKEARFIGSPIDLIVFDGIESDDPSKIKIYFIEVKTSSSALSKRQRVIRDAVENHQVYWRELRV